MLNKGKYEAIGLVKQVQPHKSAYYEKIITRFFEILEILTQDQFVYQVGSEMVGKYLEVRVLVDGLGVVRDKKDFLTLCSMCRAIRTENGGEDSTNVFFTLYV